MKNGLWWRTNALENSYAGVCSLGGDIKCCKMSHQGFDCENSGKKM